MTCSIVTLEWQYEKPTILLYKKITNNIIIFDWYAEADSIKQKPIDSSTNTISKKCTDWIVFGSIEFEGDIVR